MAKLEDAISFFQKVVLLNIWASNPRDQLKYRLSEGSIAGSEEHLGGGERGGSTDVGADSGAKATQGFSCPIIYVFKDTQPCEDPYNYVVTGWGGTGTEADQVEEYCGISSLPPTREDRVDLRLKGVGLVHLLRFLHETRENREIASGDRDTLCGESRE